MTRLLDYAYLGWLAMVIVAVSMLEYTGHPLDATVLVFTVLFEPHRNTCLDAILRRRRRKSPKTRQ